MAKLQKIASRALPWICTQGNFGNGSLKAKQSLMEIFKRNKISKDFYLTAEKESILALMKRVRSFDTTALFEMIKKYRFTDSGQEALELAGTYFLDRGNFELAHLLFSLALQDRKAFDQRLGQKQTPLLIKAALAAQRSGRTKQSKKLLDTLEKIAGEKIKLGSRWVETKSFKEWALKLTKISQPDQAIRSALYGVELSDRRWAQLILSQYSFSELETLYPNTFGPKSALRTYLKTPEKGTEHYSKCMLLDPKVFVRSNKISKTLQKLAIDIASGTEDLLAVKDALKHPQLASYADTTLSGKKYLVELAKSVLGPKRNEWHSNLKTKVEKDILNYHPRQYEAISHAIKLGIINTYPELFARIVENLGHSSYKSQDQARKVFKQHIDSLGLSAKQLEKLGSTGDDSRGEIYTFLAQEKPALLVQMLTLSIAPKYKREMLPILARKVGSLSDGAVETLLKGISGTKFLGNTRLLILALTGAKSVGAKAKISKALSEIADDQKRNMAIRKTALWTLDKLGEQTIPFWSKHLKTPGLASIARKRLLQQSPAQLLKALEKSNDSREIQELALMLGIQGNAAGPQELQILEAAQKKLPEKDRKRLNWAVRRLKSKNPRGLNLATALRMGGILKTVGNLETAIQSLSLPPLRKRSGILPRLNQLWSSLVNLGLHAHLLRSKAVAPEDKQALVEMERELMVDGTSTRQFSIPRLMDWISRLILD